MGKRPEFCSIKTFEEFSKYYWYREELIKICRSLGLKSDGGKIELNGVIKSYFAGEKILPQIKQHGKKEAAFCKEFSASCKKSTKGKSVCELSLKTGLIECGFTFGNRFREFFASQTGIQKFKFNADMVATVKKVKEIVENKRKSGYNNIVKDTNRNPMVKSSFRAGSLGFLCAYT